MVGVGDRVVGHQNRAIHGVAGQRFAAGLCRHNQVTLLSDSLALNCLNPEKSWRGWRVHPLVDPQVPLDGALQVLFELQLLGLNQTRELLPHKPSEYIAGIAAAIQEVGCHGWACFRSLAVHVRVSCCIFGQPSVKNTNTLSRFGV